MPNTEVKKPLSEVAISQIRSMMNLPTHLHEQIGNEEINLFASYLWYWRVRMEMLRRKVAWVCKKGVLNHAPVHDLVCHEKFILWVVGILSDGGKVVAVGELEKPCEPTLTEWLSYFTPAKIAA